MPSWDVLGGWLVLAGVVFGIWFGRRAGRKRAENIRSEAFAEGGKAALSAHMAQTVIVGSDLRRTDVRLDGAADGSSDHGSIDYGSIYNLDRSDPRDAVERSRDDVLGRGAPLVPLADRHGLIGIPGRSVKREDES